MSYNGLRMYRINRVKGEGFVVELQTSNRPASEVQTCATREIALAVRNALINDDLRKGLDAQSGADIETN